MPWIEKQHRDTHECRPPMPRLRITPGSVWQCRRCKAQWRLKSNYIKADGYTQAWVWSPEPRTTEVTGQ